MAGESQKGGLVMFDVQPIIDSCVPLIVASATVGLFLALAKMGINLFLGMITKGKVEL